MLKNKANIIKRFTSILLIGVVIYLLSINEEVINTIKTLSAGQLATSAIFAFFLYAFSGLKLNVLIAKSQNINISFWDTILYPSAENFFGYLMPKGGFLYFMLFFKTKYKIVLKDSISITMFTYLITLLFTGILGLVYVFREDQVFSIVGIISLCLLLSPLFLFLFYTIFKNKEFSNSFIGKTLKYISEVIENVHLLSKDYSLLFFYTLLYFGKFFLVTLWYHWILVQLNVDLSYFEVLIITLLYNEVSVIFQLVPANLGVNEMVAGGIFALFGLPPTTGILFSIFVRVSSILANFPIGASFVIYNLKYVKSQGFSQLWKKLKSNTDT